MQRGVKISLIVFGIVVILVLALWLLSPLFIDREVNEESPLVSDSEDSVVLGQFQDADNFHKVSGIAKIINDGEKKYLRFENFDATNGPDLKVYLSNDLEASDYVSLGKLKGNVGNQNYDLENINYEDYEYVLVWCEAFSVLFGYSGI